MQHRTYILDLAGLIFLLLFALFFAITFVNFETHPMEDAAILMRYAKHFAEGYGIVWNIGDAPVEGATDFLFMVAVAGLVRSGMSLELATRFIGFCSHILMAGTVYLSSRRVFGAPWLVALGISIILSVGPGFYYVAVYFGTPFFALSACLSWWVALAIIQNGEDHKKSLLFASASLITGLIRPEGVFLTGFMLLAILFIKGMKGGRFTLLYYLVFFLFFGGAYFLWRWQYFGYPLPNPYYKKGDLHVYLDSLRASYTNMVFLCLPLLPAFIVGMSFGKTIRKTVGFLLPIIGFTTLFILLTDEMNFNGRFQYVALPLAAMVFWPLTQGAREWLKLSEWKSLTKEQHLFYSLFSLILFSGSLKYMYDLSQVRYYSDGKYSVAIMLSEYKDKRLRLATSEAGLLPLYSQFRSLDTWGLNDPWIAHHGRITAAYLSDFDPHIIVFHAYFSPLADSHQRDEWNEMAMVLRQYAEQQGYLLAAAFGSSPYETEYYYVRSDFPESVEIVNRIRATDYRSGLTGMKLTNYVLETEE